MSAAGRMVFLLNEVTTWSLALCDDWVGVFVGGFRWVMRKACREPRGEPILDSFLSAGLPDGTSKGCRRLVLVRAFPERSAY